MSFLICNTNSLVDSTEHHIDVNEKDSNGCTRIQRAVSLGEINTIRELLQNPNTDLSVKSQKGYSLLEQAFYSNRIDVIHTLLESERIDPNAPNQMGHTPLVWAVIHKKVDIIRALVLNPRIEVNAKDDKNSTALHYATSASVFDVDMSRALLENENTDVNTKNNIGNSPVDIAAQQVGTGLLELFAADGRTDFSLLQNWVKDQLEPDQKAVINQGINQKINSIITEIEPYLIPPIAKIVADHVEALME